MFIKMVSNLSEYLPQNELSYFNVFQERTISWLS